PATSLQLHSFPTRRSSDLPARGLFRHVKYRDVESQVATPVEPPKIKEEDFYGSFADYLVKELEECSKAIVLGGNKFKDKWGTPEDRKSTRLNSSHVSISYA